MEIIQYGHGNYVMGQYGHGDNTEWAWLLIGQFRRGNCTV